MAVLNSMKGYRTYLFNVLAFLVTVAGFILQYLGDLGLSDRDAALIAIGLNSFVTCANMALRSVTNTAPGKRE